jgi:D-sedoheptulose 7-phosphate isomerase
MQNRKEAMQFAEEYLHSLIEALEGMDTAAIAKAITWLKETRDNGRFVYVCGNGGSASIASHFVVDLIKGASVKNQKRFKIIALNDSISTITAYANDVSYDDVFVEQLRNFAQEGDLLLAISTSGNSRNVLHAVDYANSIGCRTIALTRMSGGALKEMAQHILAAPTDHTGRLEDCFHAMAHIMIYALMENASSYQLE